MNLKVKLLLFLVSVSSVSNAQLTDTLFVKQNDFYNSVYENFTDNPLFYTNSYFKDFTLTQLDFQRKEFGFKRVQTAEKITNFNFATQGIFNVNSKLRIFGDVFFAKSFEKELGYNFSSERTENQNVLSPNYFFTPKKGNWEHQNYNLVGGLAYEFSNHILTGGKLFYKNTKSFRVVDPRPQLAINNYGAELMLGYQLQNHRVFGSVSIAKETETGSIIYVDDTQNAPVYTDTFTQFSSGYGRVVFNNSYNSFIYRTINKGFRLGYQYQFDKHQFVATYGYNKSMENSYGKDANGYTYIAEDLVRFKYRIIEHNAKINYYFDGDAKDYKVDVAFSSKQGDNFSVAENGQNYRMTIDKVQLQTGRIKKLSDATNFAIEVGTAFTQHRYIDLLGSTNKKLNTLEVNASANKDFSINSKSNLNIGLAFSHYTALDEDLKLIATTTNTSFTDNVIIPDHAYDVTSKLQSKITLNYTISLPKSKQLRIFATSQFLDALDSKHEAFYPISTSTSTQFNAGIAILY